MKTPIIILHGWGASSRSFDKVKEILTRKGFLLFIPDLPGFDNELPPPAAWSVDDYAEWMKARIGQNVKISPNPPLSPHERPPEEWQKGGDVSATLQKEGETSLLLQGVGDESVALQNEVGVVDKFILFGHSFGGRIAIKFAAKYPEKLVGLILCDAAGITPRPKMKINIFNALSGAGKIIFSWPILRYFQPLVRKIEYFLAGSRDYYYLQDPIMKETFKRVIEEDLTPYLDKIKIPTLIVWGKKDKMTPVSDAYIMNKKIAGSKLEVLEGTGHSPHLEAPKKLAAIIDKFIKELPN